MIFQTGGVLAVRIHNTRSELKKLWLKLWGGGVILVLTGFLLAWWFIKPAPPRTVVIAAGPKDGAYYEYAEQYAEYCRPYGITLKVRETSGSLENYELIAHDESVNLAIVQGGTAPDDIRKSTKIESIASLYLEPLWVFYRANRTVSDLRDLQSMRIAVGRVGSGTQSIAELLLRENGVVADNETEFITTGGREAVGRLQAGSIDAAFFVVSANSTLIRELMADEDIQLMNFERHTAYSRRHPFLTGITLERGVIDLEADFPAQDVQLVAPAAILVASAELHDALIPLLMRATILTHEKGTNFTDPGRFPSMDLVEFPLNPSARRYFESGPPFLQKYLPFWVASAVDRGKILLLPLLTLLFPLLKIAPPVYRWRIRSRIYRWYGVLRKIEAELQQPVESGVLETNSKILADMERELDDLDSVPLAYMEEFYNLRLHAEFVARRVTQARQAKREEDAK